MNYLRLDQYTNIIHYYHKSGKYIIPLNIASYFSLSQNIDNRIKNTIQDINILNIGFHSYISVHSIISDYVKHKHIEPLLRIINTKSIKSLTKNFLILKRHLKKF